MRTLNYRSILVASDLTEGCDAVIRAAARLAEHADAELHVVHVYELPALPHHDERRYGTAYHNRIHELRRELTKQIRRALPEGTGVASGKVVSGRTAPEILNCAESLSADLIVLGPHRPRAVGDRFLGSTADAIIRMAEVPCLIIRDELALPLRRVTVPIDLSEPARGALDLALAWCASSAAVHGDNSRVHLRVAHVLSDVGDHDQSSMVRIGDELHREVEEAVERLRRPADVEIHEQVVGGGTPAEEILRIADSGRTDLLVLGTRGHGTLKRAWLGSVSSEVARRATCPVLLVPPALWRAEAAQEPGTTTEQPFVPAFGLW